MAEQAYWYVVHTYSGYENKVATDLMTMVENRRIRRHTKVCQIVLLIRLLLHRQPSNGRQHLFHMVLSSYFPY